MKKMWKVAAAGGVLWAVSCGSIASALTATLTTDCRRELNSFQFADAGTTQLARSARVVFEDAQSHFRHRRYAVAFARFAGLADAGHVPSAGIALVMLEGGRALFDSEWSAPAEQQCRWRRLVVNRTLKGVDLLDDGRGG
jgi:hypothetical protein